MKKYAKWRINLGNKRIFSDLSEGQAEGEIKKMEEKLKGAV